MAKEERRGYLVRLPEYLQDEITDVLYFLRKRNPSFYWSQNKIFCEAVRAWIIGVKKQLELEKEKK